MTLFFTGCLILIAGMFFSNDLVIVCGIILMAIDRSAERIIDEIKGDKK